MRTDGVAALANLHGPHSVHTAAGQTQTLSSLFPIGPANHASLPTPPLSVVQSKITREELENQRQLLVDLRHEIGELKSIHQAGVVGTKGGGTRGGYGTAMPASEFFKQGADCTKPSTILRGCCVSFLSLRALFVLADIGGVFTVSPRSTFCMCPSIHPFLSFCGAVPVWRWFDSCVVPFCSAVRET